MGLTRRTRLLGCRASLRVRHRDPLHLDPSHSCGASCERPSLGPGRAASSPTRVWLPQATTPAPPPPHYHPLAPTSGGGEPLGHEWRESEWLRLPSRRPHWGSGRRWLHPSAPSPRMKGVTYRNIPTGVGLQQLSSDQGRRAVGLVWPGSSLGLLSVSPCAWAEPDVGVPAHPPHQLACPPLPSALAQRPLQV